MNTKSSIICRIDAIIRKKRAIREFPIERNIASNRLYNIVKIRPEKIVIR